MIDARKPASRHRLGLQAVNEGIDCMCKWRGLPTVELTVEPENIDDIFRTHDSFREWLEKYVEGHCL